MLSCTGKITDNDWIYVFFIHTYMHTHTHTPVGNYQYLVYLLAEQKWKLDVVMVWNNGCKATIRPASPSCTSFLSIFLSSLFISLKLSLCFFLPNIFFFFAFHPSNDKYQKHEERRSISTKSCEDSSLSLSLCNRWRDLSIVCVIDLDILFFS